MTVGELMAVLARMDGGDDVMIESEPGDYRPKEVNTVWKHEAYDSSGRTSRSGVVISTAYMPD